MTRDSARRLAWVGPLIALFLAAGGAGAQVELRGRVVSDSGTPIAGATITHPGTGFVVRADSLGQFLLAGAPGSTISLVLRAAGYRDDSGSVVLGRRPILRDFVMVSTTTMPPEANPSADVLRGRVTDTEGTPLAFATVQLNGGRRFVADDSGRFTVPVHASGRLALLFRRIGFEPEEVRLDTRPDTALRVRMTAAAATLPEYRITASTPFTSLTLGGFYRRVVDAERGINRGWFITPEELEARRPVVLTSVVENIPNIRVRQAPRPLAPGGPIIHRQRIEDAMGCPMTVYVDRIKVTPVVRRGVLYDEHINSLLVPTTLAGMEVYPRRAGAPPEYAIVEGTCGVVLIWTK